MGEFHLLLLQNKVKRVNLLHVLDGYPGLQ